MERKRSQYQRLKQQQQQQQRFCVSQQDLTHALARMKSPTNHFEQESFGILKNSSSSSAIESLDNRTVSKLVKEFEARAIINSYGSTQNLLPIGNNLISTQAECNSSHMFVRTMEFKVDNSDNGIINNNVCSLISSSIVNDSQMAIVEIQPESSTDDKEQEKNDEQIYETLYTDPHKVDLTSTAPLYTTIDKHYNNPIDMVTRSTNIDEAAKALRKRHHISFDELLVKEAQLNHALADLISISNDNDKTLSMNSSPKPTINNNSRRRTFSAKHNYNDMSATVDLLNNLLKNFDLDKVDSEKKNIEPSVNLRNQKNDDNHIKPINMFW